MMHHADAHDTVAVAAQAAKDAFFQVNDVVAADFPNNQADRGGVFEFNADCTVNDCFHTLAKQNILSAPVWDETKKKYLGFVDVADLLALAFGIDLLTNLMPDSMFVDAASAKKMKPETNVTPIRMLFEDDQTTLTTKWCPVSPTTPFKEILLLLATQTRRVPVIDPSTGKCISIITQSAVVSELYHHILSAGVHAPKSLMATPRQTGIGSKKVISIREDEPAREAYAKIIENKISAVAVLDYEGHLLTCISTKDVRLLPTIENSVLTHGHRSVLDMPARNYAAAVRRVTEKTGAARPSVVVCGLDTPMKIIIGKLAETKMHRIFMVGQNDAPIGVISVSDIMQLLVEQQVWDDKKN